MTKIYVVLTWNAFPEPDDFWLDGGESWSFAARVRAADADEALAAAGATREGPRMRAVAAARHPALAAKARRAEQRAR